MQNHNSGKKGEIVAVVLVAVIVATILLIGFFAYFFFGYKPNTIQELPQVVD